MKSYDAVVIGAGAAGMMCAAELGLSGKRVALVDHSERIAEKIRISGGGRCNFTNRCVGVENFVGENPKFAAKALKAYPSDAFIQLVKSHDIPFHEKHKGQLFCNRKSDDIIQMLVSRCGQAKVTWYRPCQIAEVGRSLDRFALSTSAGGLETANLVIATGGLPIPKIGATDFGLRIAKQFGHRIVDTRPALVPLTFDADAWRPWASLAGISIPVLCHAGPDSAPWFDEDLLFTHRGLSGPAILQASSFWQHGEPIELNLLRQPDLPSWVTQSLAGAQGTRLQFANWITALLTEWPKRLTEQWLQHPELAALSSRRAAELGKKHIHRLAQLVCEWQLTPTGSEGYKKAEVMRGGVATADLKADSMASKLVPGLFFIGEVVDITGWLGGYNFQWAWASGVSAARSISKINT